MGEPIVKLVVDVPPEIKEKAKRIAHRREISLKELIVQLIKDVPESHKKQKVEKAGFTAIKRK